MLAVIVHEVSHGWVAFRLGDPTAFQAGRLTLNPLRHIDPVGTVLLPLFLQLAHAPVIFGWAKPVPIDASRLAHPRRDLFWIGAAGPAANFLLAAGLAAGVNFSADFFHPLLLELARTAILINLLLGVFNLLPIPPLDGSRVLGGLLPGRFSFALLKLERWGIVLILLFLLMGLDDRILRPVVDRLARGLGL